jgi:quaternary ammonium compound-resistance protein SugE
MLASLISSPDEADPYQASTTGRGSFSMAWLVLLIAGLLEMVWALGLKYTHGFTRPVPSAITAAAIVASMFLLARTARTIPIGTAYAVWVGIGAVGAAIGGAVLFAEPLPPARIAFLTLLVIALVGLKLTSPA